MQFPAKKTHEKPAESDWQTLMKESLIPVAELISYLELPKTYLPGAENGHQLFELRAPKPYLDRIEKGNPDDPLLRQILPLQQESLQVSGYITDPLEEKVSNPIPGLIHKYKSRVLLIGSGACAINCRYCFRRHFPYQDNGLSNERIDQVVRYLLDQKDVNEVILSGGDPLATPDRRLQKLVEQLSAVPHIKRLRIHTRLPVVIPQRITDQLVSLLSQSRLKVIWVLHINHSNEIDHQVVSAVRKLTDNRMSVLNQSVILKGVNDSVRALTDLSESLFDAGILPYYLHAFDPVQGASHFDVPDHQLIKLWRELQSELPGFLVPKLTREEPGKASKTLLF
nr:EF-P beta-lysylation protein EpmB [Oceanospirillum linum]